jgi:hypothetical protein
MHRRAVSVSGNLPEGKQASKRSVIAAGADDWQEKEVHEQADRLWQCQVPTPTIHKSTNPPIHQSTNPQILKIHKIQNPLSLASIIFLLLSVVSRHQRHGAVGE